MSILTSLWKRDQGPQYESMQMDDLLADYDFVHVDDEAGKQFAVVVPKTRNESADLGELGSSSSTGWTSQHREEYNSAMRGIKGLELFDQMRRSDGGVRSTLRAAKTPVLAARWFTAPGGKTARDIKAAEWVEYNLKELMTTSWAQTLTEALLMLDYGYYMFEKVWVNKVVNGEMRTVLQKLAPRHPMDVTGWILDANGGPRAVKMADGNGGDTIIPIEKLLVFSFDKEASNIQGISILRSAYKHWYYKEQLYKIDAIQKERHGIGIPVIKLPMGWTEKDKIAAENLGRNIRTNERAHIVLPPGWDIAMLKLEGQPVDCLKSIEHHDSMIRMNILGEFLASSGSKEEDQTMFLKATRFVADIVADTINAYLVPQMTLYNFALAQFPKLKARRIGEQEDQRTMSFTVRNLVGAGVIVPDEPLEAAMREFLDLPPADPATARPQVTPQNANEEEEDEKDKKDPNTPDEEENGEVDNPSASGARVGPPRQSQVKNQRNARGLPGRGAGRDGRGN